MVPLIILFVFSYLYSGHFNYTYIINSGGYYSFYVDANPIIFIILYILCIFLFFIFFTNLGLIVVRKIIILLLLLLKVFAFIVVDIILELLLGVIMSNILFNGFSSRFNIVNILNIGYAQNIFEMLLLPISLVIISFIVVIIIYKNKEKFIIDCEKIIREELMYFENKNWKFNKRV